MGVSHFITGTVMPVRTGLTLKARPLWVYGALFIAVWLSGCASTPTPLTLPSVSIQDPAFRTSLEAFAGAPIIGDNRIDILLNGEQTFPALLEAIRSARTTVTFEAYIFHEGKVADEIVKTFVDRCRAGVRVSILLDAHGADGLPERYIEAVVGGLIDAESVRTALVAEHIERLHRCTSRRDDVLDEADALARFVEPFEPVRSPVLLGGLADDQERQARGQRGSRRECHRTELRAGEPNRVRLVLGDGCCDVLAERREQVGPGLEPVLVEVVARAPPRAKDEVALEVCMLLDCRS